MRRIVFGLLAATAIAAVTTAPAEASGGCGPGWHRTPWGACRPNWGWGGGYYGGPVYGYGWGYGHRWYGGYGGWHHGWRRHW